MGEAHWLAELPRMSLETCGPGDLGIVIVTLRAYRKVSAVVIYQNKARRRRGHLMVMRKTCARARAARAAVQAQRRRLGRRDRRRGPALRLRGRGRAPAARAPGRPDGDHAQLEVAVPARLGLWLWLWVEEGVRRGPEVRYVGRRVVSSGRWTRIGSFVVCTHFSWAGA